ncbi:hypothetical protein J6590_007994 [Homalodisca vitripennis]|nr:hypothetical protein J6590_007994 [Homalodisca vitripennis]
MPAGLPTRVPGTLCGDAAARGVYYKMACGTDLDVTNRVRECKTDFQACACMAEILLPRYVSSQPTEKEFRRQHEAEVRHYNLFATLADSWRPRERGPAARGGDRSDDNFRKLLIKFIQHSTGDNVFLVPLLPSLKLWNSYNCLKYDREFHDK